MQGVSQLTDDRRLQSSVWHSRYPDTQVLNRIYSWSGASNSPPRSVECSQEAPGSAHKMKSGLDRQVASASDCNERSAAQLFLGRTKNIAR